MKTTNTESMQESKKDCCTGTHFWVWASIRIGIVVALIVGAFFLGSQYGHDCMGHRGYDKGFKMSDMRGGYEKMQKQKNIKMAPQEEHDMMSMSMTDMSKMLEGKTGDDLNKSFLEGMIPHHQAAVDMAKSLAGSNKPELVKLGADIITAQTREIEQMKKWMKDWGYTQTGSTSTGAINMHMMPDGTMMHN